MTIVYFRFAAQAGEPRVRAPLLESLLARAAAPAETADWRADAFQALAGAGTQPPAVGAALLYATQARGTAGLPRGTAGWVCVAAPVHMSAGLRSVSLPADGVLTLSPAEVQALSTDFNHVFAGSGMRLTAVDGRSLLCVFERVLEAVTHDPQRVAGNDVFAFQPGGKDGARLRKAMSEMEMWLHDHELNRLRGAVGSVPVTGLWLWGGGVPLAAPADIDCWNAGVDPLFTALCARRSPAGSAPAGAELPPGSGVIVVEHAPGTSAWAETQRRWFEPAAAALRSGRVSRLDISAGARRFSLRRRSLWRIWRRAMPWWDSFGLGVTP